MLAIPLETSMLQHGKPVSAQGDCGLVVRARRRTWPCAQGARLKQRAFPDAVLCECRAYASARIAAIICRSFWKARFVGDFLQRLVVDLALMRLDGTYRLEPHRS